MNRKSLEKMTPVITITVVQERNGVQIHCSYNGFQKSNAANVATQMLAATELYRDLHEAVVEMCSNCPSGKDCGGEMCESTADCFVAKWKMTLEKARDNDLAGTVPAGNITSTERRDHEG